MIAYLKGKLFAKQANSVIVETNGVGYEVIIPLSTFYELGDEGTEVELRIYTHVREDTLQLFGFKTERERELYLKLISVQGIGAKSGVAMLSGMSADEIVDSIRTDNIVRLTAIPGVGRKTAERLIIELRDKIADLFTGAERQAGPGGQAGAPADETYEDALSALTNLGYNRAAADKALKQTVKEGTEMSVQKLLRRSLQILAK